MRQQQLFKHCLKKSRERSPVSSCYLSQLLLRSPTAHSSAAKKQQSVDRMLQLQRAANTRNLSPRGDTLQQLRRLTIKRQQQQHSNANKLTRYKCRFKGREHQRTSPLLLLLPLLLQLLLQAPTAVSCLLTSPQRQ